MVDSPHTTTTHIEQNQSGKEVTANAALDRIANFVAETRTYSGVSADVTPTFAAPDFEWQTAVRFVLDGTPGSPVSFYAPSGATLRKLFVLVNNLDADVVARVTGDAGLYVTVESGKARLLYSDGTDVVAGEEAVVPTERRVFIPAERIQPTAAGGCAALASVATGANLPDVTSLDFDQTTAEHAQFSYVFDDPAHMGNVSIQFLWSHAAAASFGVAWNAKAVALSNDDAVGSAFEAARKVVDTGGTTDDHYVSDRTGFVKIASPADLDMAVFDLFRDPTDGADDLDADARLQGIIVHYWDNQPLDPEWGNVVLLAGFDGEDAATDQGDESDSGHTPTYGGNAQVDTAQSVFSRASLLMDGTGDFVSFPDSADWQFGSGAFTIEGWFRWNSDPSAFQLLMGQFLAAGNQRSFALYRNGGSDLLELRLSTDGSAVEVEISETFDPTLDTWYHIAVDFDGTDYRLYLDGQVLGSSTNSHTLHNSTAAFSIGCQTDGTNPFDGWADEVRVTKGAARYAGAFPVPSAPFPRA